MADKATAPPRGPDGRFVGGTSDPNLWRSGTGDRAAPSSPSAGSDTYAVQLEAATKLKVSLERRQAEQEILRAHVRDEDVLTILTVAMMAKFTVVWADCKLVCSDAPDCMRRLQATRGLVLARESRSACPEPG